MDRVTVVNYCLGLLGLLLLQGVLNVEGRSILNPGLELANKLAELEQLRALREDLELEREITANLAEGKSITRKRGELLELGDTILLRYAHRK
ncbi:urotensin 2 domain containing [Lates japonicus]|uniref:Urotensin 2 domain containing n=1 Tax=Lates japonicus TaxID=270547 RepID=A0AAD3QZ56_LATJO|nr:urotensin 2 domain containing [Lates japonicus]